MKKHLTCSLLLITLISASTSAATWSMEGCIKYALAHNISIKDNELNVRLASLNLQQSKLSQLPSINASTAYGRSSSSTTDPTTGAPADLNYNFTNITGNANVLLFGWFARRNIIAKDKLMQQAANEEYNQLKQDVSLNVATGYLRALLAKERVDVSRKQMDLTSLQMKQAMAKVSVGVATELESLLMQSQLSIDSTNYLGAVALYNSAILDLKALLALDAKDNFEIVSPEDALKTPADIMQYTPEVVYATAIEKQGKMRSIDYTVQAMQRQADVAAALRYPRLSFVTQLSTVYTNIGKNYSFNGYNNVVIPSTYIDVNGQQYPVYQSTPSYNVRQATFGEQLGNNLSTIYALSLNVPLFNGWQTSYNAKSARISLQSEQYKKDEAAIQLRTDIYKAYDEMSMAAQKYNAARHALQVSQNAAYFSQERMNTGLMTTLEYLQVKNNAYSVNAQMLNAKYDYILRLKILDYYMGKPIML